MDTLSPGLRRVRAPNPGPMTGRGTNTYVLGHSETIVIDPGPALPNHIEAILRAAPGPIRWILVTHTHLDHSPAAQLLAGLSGGQIAGRPAPADGRQDRSLVLDRRLEDHDTLETADCCLRAVHTPGHASNHLCYWDSAAAALYTGDHVIEGSTVVIDPPDGNMADYLGSLEKIRSLGAARLLPGHGEPIPDPDAAIVALRAHRLRREAKVTAALAQAEAVDIADLLPSVYDDVSPALHGIASRSLLAHLLKLEIEGIAARDGNRWRRR